MSRSDGEIRTELESELRWQPGLNALDIAVLVTEGCATLSGHARSLAEKLQAENAIKRVPGVLAVVNGICVCDGEQTLSDPEVARTALRALRAQLPCVLESIKLVVSAGQVLLEGNARWHFLVEQAAGIISQVPGVTRVIDAVCIQRDAQSEQVRDKIVAALARSAQVDGNAVNVTSEEGTVTLSGRVRSLAECEETLRAAWSTPGVVRVNNEILIQP